MHLLITGGAGFIGANFIGLIRGSGHRITNLDLLTYAANLPNRAPYQESGDYRFLKADIADAQTIDALFAESAFDAVINFAAESHVDRSIEGAMNFVHTNVTGTVVLLEAAKRYGVKTFIQISTDEVYGSLEEGKFTLDSPINPSSPYSASKAAADHLALSFYHTHGMDVRVTRCTNNFGKFQHPEKFIPTIILNALNGREIPVYGDGKYVRDWIFVRDHCEGILAVLEKGKAGETYLFGGSTEVENNDLVRTVLKLIEQKTSTGGLDTLIKHVTDRPGHDRRYAIDWSKTEQQLGWSPATSFEQALDETVEWYVGHRDWWEKN